MALGIIESCHYDHMDYGFTTQQCKLFNSLTSEIHTHAHTHIIPFLTYNMGTVISSLMELI